jgi:hypothetical protein
LDFGTEDTVNHIMRAGIPYGPECEFSIATRSSVDERFVVTDEEKASNTSGSVERGLAFGMNSIVLRDRFLHYSILHQYPTSQVYPMASASYNRHGPTTQGEAIHCPCLRAPVQFLFSFVRGNVGFDPIIGANQGQPRTIAGAIDPGSPSSTLTMTTDFVVSRGGEYFFAPSLSAILNTIVPAPLE